MSPGIDLSGRAVFVTGPAKGMGPAIVDMLVEAGAAVALAARDRAALSEQAEALAARGGRAVAIPCDVTDEGSVAAAVAQARAAFDKRHWGLVNVAGGTGPSGRMLWEHTVEDYREVFDLNVMGTFLTMKHWLPPMIEARAGGIVNIGGTFGFKGVREASAYGATKWALRGFTKSAALEAGHAGVRVNMVSPGGVDGPRLRRQLGEAAERRGIPAAEAYDSFAASTALGRMSTSEDVAGAVLYLLSDLSRNVTGQDLLVDGGTVV
ncbi:SDR family NAD(P)-dependent oxidoreductase [Histidinibacterium lentulum]|uniref:SDR family oxidoreductase n=1 Tax=Histidinibacterium lentulum TaxID=2480588 RepID=A0A3N2R5Z9_9RHOB|nr:SDR family NAD(P)-dependent oxidoreductase [Histidinibacterium lentulum]ROU02912.1 SDR family oxidoreductase [Histidinibacterium lentulum]